MMSRRLLVLFLSMAWTLSSAGQAARESVYPSARQISIQHTVAVADIGKHYFHVTSLFGNLSQPILTLALPTWSPGWYSIHNYAKNILRMTFTDGAGHALPNRMTRKQTWEVGTRGAREVRVEFDYRANFMAVDQAEITPTFAFFTGTQLFLEPVGHRANPASVRFVVPSGWKILSALQSTQNPAVFTAADYDQLVDAPTELGTFDVTHYDVDGTPHFFAVTPTGTYSAADYANVTPLMAKITHAEATVFGGQPYEKYVSYYFFLPTETTGSLEHLNSQVVIIPARPAVRILPLFAHESFHAWNVKRLRPAQMWPYDYSHENETPLLWMSEGFTDYYGLISRLRAGVSSANVCCVNDSQFLDVTAYAIGYVESNDARHYQSMADASTSTWIGYGYDTPPAFSVDYYPGGQVIATLLDVMLHNDTDGKRGLDDAMRWLWNNTYRKGRGFTTQDFEVALRAVSGKSYANFIHRYVEGTEVPPYDSIFSAVGYDLVLTKTIEATSGLYDGTSTAAGWLVKGLDTNGPYANAGGQVGDVLVSINGDALSNSLPALPAKLAGKDVTFVIVRRGKQQTIIVSVPADTKVTAKFVAEALPSARQMKIRNAWLAKK